MHMTVQRSKMAVNHVLYHDVIVGHTGLHAWLQFAWAFS